MQTVGKRCLALLLCLISLLTCVPAGALALEAEPSVSEAALEPGITDDPAPDADKPSTEPTSDADCQIGTAISAYEIASVIGTPKDWSESKVLPAIVYLQQQDDGKFNVTEFHGKKTDLVSLTKANALVMALTKTKHRSVALEIVSDTPDAFIMAGNDMTRIALDREDHLYDLTKYLTDDNILVLYGGDCNVKAGMLSLDDGAQLDKLDLNKAIEIVETAAAVKKDDFETEDIPVENATPTEESASAEVIIPVKEDTPVDEAVSDTEPISVEEIAPVDDGSVSTEEPTPIEESVPPEETAAAVEDIPAEETAPVEEAELIVEPEEESAALAMPAFSQSVTADDVIVRVSAEDGTFPEGSALSVAKIQAQEDTKVSHAVETERNDGETVARAYTFDIKVLDAEGYEIQPADGKQVKVSFSMAEIADQNLTTNVYHVAEQEDGALSAEKLDVETKGNTASAETDGFSYYQVEFTYNELQYVMPGDSAVALEDILDYLGLTGEVETVEVSNPKLFSAEKQDGKWIVTAHQAFSTTEWMKVTINGVVYEIVVTDIAKPTFNTDEKSGTRPYGATAIWVIWNGVSGADGYRVKWAVKGSGSWSAVQTVSGKTTYKINGLKENTDYTVAVEAYSGKSNSGYATRTVTTSEKAVMTYSKDSVAPVTHGTAGGHDYGLNEHKVVYGDGNYPAYCVDRYVSSFHGAAASYAFNIRNMSDIESSSRKYSAFTKNTLPLAVSIGYSGYKTSEIEDARRILNVQLKGDPAWLELLGATQCAVWALCEDDYNNTKSLTEQSPYVIQHSNRGSVDGATAATRIARAAVDIYRNGNPTYSISSKKTGTSGANDIYTVTVTCKRLYGGYDMKISGLPAGAKIQNLKKGSLALKWDEAKNTIVSTTNFDKPSYTDTFEISVPRAAAAGSTITMKAESVISISNADIRFVKHPSGTNYQNMVYVYGSGDPIQKTAKLKIDTPTGSITVRKIDSITGAALKGAEFSLYESTTSSFGGWQYVTKGTTDSSGEVTFDDLECNATNGGVYRVKETGAPPGHTVDSSFYADARLTAGTWHYQSTFVPTQMNDVNPGKLTGKTYTAKINGKAVNVASAGNLNVNNPALDVTFTAADDVDEKFNITVQKRDLSTGNTVTDGGIEFTLQKKTTSGWTDHSKASIDGNGRVTWSNLDPALSTDGTFRILESKVTNTKYIRDTKFYAIVNPNNGNWSYDSSLVSAASGTGLIGYKAAKINTLDGNSPERNIVWGEKDSADQKYNFWIYQDDQPDVHQDLTVNKYVMVDGTKRMISGMTFTLMHKKTDGTYEKVGDLKEGAVGVYQIPENGNEWAFNMVYGDSYRVEEVNVPSGVLNSGWKSADFKWQKLTTINLSYSVENKEPKGCLGVQKVDSETGKPMKDIEFTVTAANDVTTTVGGIAHTWYAKGVQVAKGKTDANGYYHVTGLPYGAYTVTETGHPDEYHYESVSFNVTISNPINYSSAKVYNDPNIGVPVYPAGSTVKNGNNVYYVVSNKPVHPSASVAKLTERTLNPSGKAVAFDAKTGRFTEDKIPGTYYNDQQAKFTLTATNTGDVDLYDLNMKDVMSPELWMTVKVQSGARKSNVTFRQVNSTELALGAELKNGAKVTTAKGKTAAVTSIAYDDASRTFNITFDKLEVGDSLKVQLTYTLYNSDNINKQNLPNDVYLYTKYLAKGTQGAKKDVPGGGTGVCHDLDKLNVVSQGYLTIHKKDTHGDVLENVHFQLLDAEEKAVPFVYQDDGSYAATVTKENGDWISAAESGKATTIDLVSNSNGAVEIVELPEGKYKLIETKTVHGQTLLAEPVTIQMPCTEKGAENTGADHNVYFDGINHYYHLYYTITNTAQFQLPYTGADNHMMLTSFLGLTLLLGLSHVIFQTWTKRRGRSLCPHRLHMMCGRFMYAALSIQSTINHQGG